MDLPSKLLSADFIQRLKTRCPTVEFILNERPDPVITIPAAHPDVGPFTISFENEEITVPKRIGEHYHCHFDLFRYEPKIPAKKSPCSTRPLPGFSRSSMTGSSSRSAGSTASYTSGRTYPTGTVGVTRL